MATVPVFERLVWVSGEVFFVRSFGNLYPWGSVVEHDVEALRQLHPEPDALAVAASLKSHGLAFLTIHVSTAR